MLINAIIISVPEKRFCPVICCRCVMSGDIPILVSSAALRCGHHVLEAFLFDD